MRSSASVLALLQVIRCSPTCAMIPAAHEDCIGRFRSCLRLAFFAPPAAAQNPKLIMEEFMVPAKDPGLQLYVP
jgi:hypothetical protein